MKEGQPRKAVRLAEKLRRIRSALGLSQSELISRLRVTASAAEEDINDIEGGTREPSLLLLLDYGRLAGVWVDVLIDDSLDLPRKLPSDPKHEGVKHKTASRSKRKR